MEIETLKSRLAEAEEAYHQLMIGAREVSVNVGNFGSLPRCFFFIGKQSYIYCLFFSLPGN